MCSLVQRGAAPRNRLEGNRLPVCVIHNQIKWRCAGLGLSISMPQPAYVVGPQNNHERQTTWQKPPFQGAASCRGDFLQASSMKASLECPLRRLPKTGYSPHRRRSWLT